VSGTTQPDAAAALAALRDRFDALDDQLVDLIAARLRLADEAASLKRDLGRPIVDPVREAAAAARRRQRARDVAGDVGMDGVVDDVFAVLVPASRARQARRQLQHQPNGQCIGSRPAVRFGC
jgi:chorismate mutase